ncbi:MAG: hypothetical protein ACI8V5_000396 [Limisphaerales bacterium]|jgi:hypothetical protein
MKNCNITLLCAALASLCAVSTFAAKPQTDQTSRLPNIDRIAKEGILFTDGHAGASTCTPTRYGFMTAGVILESLERLDIDDNTLVIFTSDNGGCPRQFNGHYPMGPILRGGKGDLVEGGTRVPFVARWPGKIKPGTVSKEIVSTTDMMATFAAITGKELPKGAGPDSYNVLSAFQGKALPDPNRPIVFVSGGTGALSIRAGKWKLIEGQGNRGYGEFRRKQPWPVPKPGAPPAQLYNLEEDLGEANNLYNQHPEIVHHLKAGLEKIKAEENYNPTALEQPKEKLTIKQAKPSPAQTLPDPDGKPADMNKPVQVYVLLGQSNMLGFGRVEQGKKGAEGSLTHAVKELGLYSYLIDDDGAWTERKDVRNVRVMGSGTGGMRLFNNEWMTIKGRTIGPEIGIGHHVGNSTDAPVMILKSCIGNRALGWDLLPPGSKGFEFTDAKGVTWIHPGYKGTPERWEKGAEPKKIKWYAGMQYDGDIARAKKALAELDKYYPGAKEYEIAGFFWWQGDRDSRSAALSSRYEKNLVHLIKQLRKDFDAPNAKFVCATLGHTEIGAADDGGEILDAMFAVDGNSDRYPEFKGNVATVYSHPLSKGGSSGGHYDGNAETYMNVGEAMGKAMVELMKSNR